MVVDTLSPRAKGPVTPEFEIDSERIVVPTLSIENVKPSGLRLSRTENLGQFYNVAGNRSILMGTEGSDFEAWIYPFKAFQNCEIGFFCSHSIIWADTIIKSFSATPEASIITYETQGLKVTQTIFAPIHEPGIVMLFKITCKKPVAIVAKLNGDLKLMWPADSIDLQAEYGCDRGTGAWVARSKDQRVVAMAGWAGGKPCTHLPEDPRLLDAIVTATEAQQDHLCSFVITGSVDGIDDARKTWIKLAKNPYELLQAASNYYHRLDTETLSISIPDKTISEAFKWAKVGLDKSYKTTPGLGSGFVAGFNRSDDSARPGCGWYFSRDSVWAQFSFDCLGEFDKSRENLELMAKYQVKNGSSKGKIRHELSAAHDFIADEHQNHAYPAGDSTPLYVIAMADYLRWTGDTDFVKSNWQHVADAIDWCYRTDVDKVDPAAIWRRALESAAEMGKSIGEQTTVDKWEKDARNVICELTTAWEIPTNSSKDPIYSSNACHEGAVWPASTGWASLASFNNHQMNEGLAYLKSNTDLTRDFSLGCIPEVLDGKNGKSIGCPHQTLSEAMVIQPIFEGLLGIRVDASKREIAFIPHIPLDWGSVKIKNLKVGANLFEISYERRDKKTRVIMKQTIGDDAYTAVISPVFEDSAINVATCVNGESFSAAVVRTPADMHIQVNAPIMGKLVVDFEEG